MKKLSTMSSKGQVVIPKEFRQLLSLTTHSKLIFENVNGNLVISSAEKTFSSKLKKSLANFDIDQSFKADWEKSLTKRVGKW